MARTFEDSDIFVVGPVLFVEGIDYPAVEHVDPALSEPFDVNEVEAWIGDFRMANVAMSIDHIVSSGE
jgi:hypothetical protein